MSRNRLVSDRIRLCIMAEEMSVRRNPPKLLQGWLGYDRLRISILHRGRI